MRVLPEPLARSRRDPNDQALAARYAPVLWFDEQEPFLPIAVGYTVVRKSAPSPSFDRAIDISSPGRPAAALAIEYAIWWDWDIGHLYELEHAWVYVAADGQVVGVEASWHGECHSLTRDGGLRVEGGRPQLYAQPGKHALAATPQAFDEIRQAQARRSETDVLAGVGGVLVNRMFAGRIRRTPFADTLARSYLASRAFRPAWRFGRRFDVTPELLVPWDALEHWIPERVNGILADLGQALPSSGYRPLRIGHRGASAHAPDNTLAGLRAAARLGAHAAEVDVQLTRDQQAILVHDSHLVDAEGRVLPVQSSTYEALRRVELAAGEHVPTLDEALAASEDLRLGLYIEIKDGRALGALAEAIRRHDAARRVVLGSFRPDWVAEAGALLPGVPTSVLFGSTRIDPVRLAAACGAAFVHPCWERQGDRPSALLTPEWIAAVRAADLGIICWHEERPEVIVDLHRLGVDGICSDRPELLLPRDRYGGERSEGQQ